MKMQIEMPNLGEDAGAEATISFWYFSEGEHVEKGEDLVEMVTEKATFNVPAPSAGCLEEILAAEGDQVSIGEVLAIIQSEG